MPFGRSGLLQRAIVFAALEDHQRVAPSGAALLSIKNES
jgi:hypothetical protein